MEALPPPFILAKGRDPGSFVPKRATRMGYRSPMPRAEDQPCSLERDGAALAPGVLVGSALEALRVAVAGLRWKGRASA